MARLLDNWLDAYLDYASPTESPRIVHFWCAVSAVAGALRRRVWFDQTKFKWFPSFYVVIVGPPGVITKSTSADGSMDLLKQIAGIHFGPDKITSQRLTEKFTEIGESFELGGEWIPMSAITCLASEFGTFMNFEDDDMVNLLITLWDGRSTYGKETKTSGNDMIEGPWINLLACTTPRWINANMSDNTIGGGFTSRCVFVYADKKERTVAYIKNMIPDKEGYAILREHLIHDLEHIAVNLKGAYSLTPEAEAWGEAWYTKLWEEYDPTRPDFVNNYLARKQGHLHKLALVMAASKRDELIITKDDLSLAETMLNQTEDEFQKVFSRVGRSEEAQHADELLAYLKARKEMPYRDLVRAASAHFPSANDLANIIKVFTDSGYMKMGPGPGGTWVTWCGDD